MIKGLSASAVAALVGPVVYAAAAAMPLPSQWKFTAAALLGAFVGANARLCIALFSAQVQSRFPALFLAFGSFWLGVIGALAAYMMGYIDGHDPIKVTGVAALSSLFGILLEMLGQKFIKARAKVLTDGVRARDSHDDYDTARAADFMAAVAADKKTNPD